MRNRMEWTRLGRGMVVAVVGMGTTASASREPRLKPRLGCLSLKRRYLLASPWRQSVGRAAALAAAAATVACASPPTDPGNQVNANQNVEIFDPANPSSDYQAVNDPGQQGLLVQQMWNTLTTPACWDATAVLPVANVSQFQFYGQYEYRHYGFSTNFGGIVLHSVGHYKGRAAAVLETWTGVLEALVIENGSKIIHAFANVENTALVVTQYGASDGPCL